MVKLQTMRDTQICQQEAIHFFGIDEIKKRLPGSCKTRRVFLKTSALRAERL